MTVLDSALIAIATAGTLLGGIYRHDVDPVLHERLAEDPAFAAVGRIHSTEGSTIGSFVLISPDWAITAAHVVAGRPPDSVILALNGESRTVREIVIHPEFQAEQHSMHGEALYRKGVDVALLHISSASNVRPAALYEGTDEVGHQATLVGFGTSGNAVSAITNPLPPGIKRAGHNMIDQVGGMVQIRPIPPWYLISDFDHPSNESFNRTGSAMPLPLEYLVAGGDSGGAVFIRVDDTWALTGIHATGRISVNDSIENDGLYGSLNLSVRIAFIREWIAATKAAGASAAR